MFEVSVLNAREHVQLTINDGSFYIGSAASEKNQIVVDDDLVSKFQCFIELLGDGSAPTHIKVTNLGRSMVVGDNSRIHHMGSRELPLPCSLGAGETQIQISRSDLQCIVDDSIRQLNSIGSSSEIEAPHAPKRLEISPSSETLASWFESLGQLQRSTAGKNDFFKLAARCVFNPGGLDGCIILRRLGNDWKVVSQHIPYPAAGISYRKDLLQKAVDARTPIFHDASQIPSELPCDYFHTSIVCPVEDCQGNVVALIYGYRNNKVSNNRKGIRILEARYVSLIADAVAAGMARLESEANHARQRILLEQAFSPEVAAHLEANPEILSGQEKDISVLFADLRGFCRISESIGAKTTYQLLTDVMNRFTNIIREHKGVVIDYYGDGLSAFWNAPVDQPDHALLAVQAGMAINQEMASLNEVWSVEIGTRLRVGIGIHTGNAQVGNSGSQDRLKYGPQGSTVNIASRLEQSTKKLGVNLVISDETAKGIEGQMITQRICKAKLPGIKTETDIFTPIDSAEFSKSSEYYLGYEKALQKFESKQYFEALEILSNLADSENTAQPMLSFLLEQINDQLGEKNQPTVKPQNPSPDSILLS